MIRLTEADGTCTHVSEGWYAFTGATPGTPLGSGWLQAIHPEDRSPVERAFAAALERRTAFHVEYRLRRRDGEYLAVADSASPRFDALGAFAGHVGPILDLAREPGGQDALRESEARFRALFTSIDEGYCLCEMILDAEGRAVDYRFLEANPLFEGMTGLADAVGRTAYELVPSLEPKWVETYGRVALEGSPLRFESESDAMGRSFDVFATPVEPRGRFALVFKDITARKRAEALQREREATERRGRRQAELLAEVVQVLERTDGLGDRLRRLVALLVPRVGDYAVVEVPEFQEPVLALSHHDRCAREVLRALRERRRLATHDAMSVSRAAVGEERLLTGITPERLGGLALDPGAARLVSELGPHSHIAVPLQIGAAAPAVLSLGLSDPERPPYSREDLMFVRRLADRVGVVLSIARLREEEHEGLLRLQRALLPQHLVDHPDVAVAARYRAAPGVLQVGGDWYDAFALPDGRIGLAVGDVVGHGLEAAAAMGRLRTAMLALAPHAGGPGELLSLLDAFAVGPNRVEFATACYAMLDPTTGVLEYAAAGHPPPLLVPFDGDAWFLEEGRSPPLHGVVDRGRGESTVVLEPGAMLVLYSDGLVERRTEALDFGLARLRRSATRARQESVDVVCDRLLADLGADAAQDDDIAVVCVRLARRGRARSTPVSS